MATFRRLTRDIEIFNRPAPSAVKYDLSIPASVTITIPVHSTWSSELHWHETHTEYLQILQGRALVRLGHLLGERGAEDGVIEVPRFAVHEWKRAAGCEVDLIVREWTVPEDGQKEIFFRMLNSFLTEPQPSSLYEPPSSPRLHGAFRRFIEPWVVMLQLFVIFRACDNWPVMVGDNNGWLSWTTTHLVLNISRAAGSCLGLRGVYEEYVGPELAARSIKHEGLKKKKKER